MKEVFKKIIVQTASRPSFNDCSIICSVTQCYTLQHSEESHLSMKNNFRFIFWGSYFYFDLTLL